MNYSTLSIAPIIFALSLGNTHAADYATTHTISSGDIISADVINDILENIELSLKPITTDELVGTWEGTQYLCAQSGTNCFGQLSNSSLFTRSSVNSFGQRAVSATFTKISSTSFTFTPSAAGVLWDANGANPQAVSGAYTCEILNGAVVFCLNNSNTANAAKMVLTRTSPTQMRWNYDFQVRNFNLLILNKINLPPTNPTAFAATTTSLSNVLTWTDNSSDESGFKVYKKTTVAGAWTLIDAGAGLTVSTNVVTYTDTVSAAGDNWYRVKANHVTNGDSIGSKVIKVTNSN